jgi:hypothetical protein
MDLVGEIKSEWPLVYPANNPSTALMTDVIEECEGFYSEHRELYSNIGMRIEYTIFLMMRLKSFRPEIDKKKQNVFLRRNTTHSWRTFSISSNLNYDMCI